ncbi:MAG: FixH family protein [Candidatus Competibacterales bacterium]|nr:FixH family protein [Candidatus Competibacterales bacterium]
MTPESKARPWYREAYLWLVLAPVIASVIAGLTTLGIAMNSGGRDALPGEFRKTGKLISSDAGNAARSSAVAASLTGHIDAQDGALFIETGLGHSMPVRVNALFVHPTFPDRDVAIVLERTGPTYRGALPSDLPPRGELHLYPDDRAWRVVAAYPSHPLRFSGK